MRNNNCFDMTELSFGLCEMVLGVGYSNNGCMWISGCGWEIDGIDYSEYFYNSIEECQNECLMTCDEIYEYYEILHGDDYSYCDTDNNCETVWGDCGVGLGGCYYAININDYPDENINYLVDMWNNNDCMEWVCDCMSMPYSQCQNNSCTLTQCIDKNPAGCYQTGCQLGYDCIETDECTASSCFCDNGMWICTEDCGGGSCVKLGDINTDGKLNVNDIVILVNLILNNEYILEGDINIDNQLNVLDIIEIANIIIG